MTNLRVKDIPLTTVKTEDTYRNANDRVTEELLQPGSSLA